jgi:hypothetical protein
MTCGTTVWPWKKGKQIIATKSKTTIPEIIVWQNLNINGITAIKSDLRIKRTNVCPWFDKLARVDF